MIADVPTFLRYFKGVHGRTVRDVTSLPAEAETWRPPPSPDEEASWGAPDIVRHMVEARLFFAGAFLGEGWVWEPWPDRLERKAEWVPALAASYEDFGSKVGSAPEERLRERVEAIASDGPNLSGWRVLMMMIEHEVHHRSQLETYAGLNGWPVNQIFGRTYEWVTDQLERERNRAE